MIVNANCLDHLRTMPDNIVDCLVSDPPYGINFMGKAWDDFSKGQEKFKKLKEEGLSGLSLAMEQNLPIYNFEGMIEFFVPIWKECLRVMKPGALGFIMCIPRQDCLSRMMISLEQAGFNINFSSIYWTYASGFPKALNIGKAIDKRAGVKGKEVIRQDFYDRSNKKECEMKQVPCGTKGVYNLPATPEAKKLEGSYGGFQPKPAVEVIIVVMKPLSKNTYIDQALDNGKGVVWFDDCRIPYKDEKDEEGVSKSFEADRTVEQSSNTTFKDLPMIKSTMNIGRFPANLLVQDDVLDDGKISKSSANGGTINSWCGKGNPAPVREELLNVGDSGIYSRYFSLDAWAEKNLPFLIVPKASKSEKNAGCDGLENKKTMGRWRDMGIGWVNSEKYIGANNHPTVKPLKLMSYLITMGSREGDVILDPFAGSGTTGCAAILLRRKYILIEMSEEYIEIIKARVEYYTKQMEAEPLKF